jgi:Flp pilus assembly protein TadG
VNPHNAQTVKPRRLFSPAGQSVTELALILPVLVLLLLVGTDLARVFFVSIGVDNAARAGAEYGSQSVITAADSNGMITAAKADGAGIVSLSVTANQCTCLSASSVPLCPSAYCTTNAQATYITVNAQAPFHTVITYPGLPSSLTLSGQAIMPVQQ